MCQCSREHPYGILAQLATRGVLVVGLPAAVTTNLFASELTQHVLGIIMDLVTAMCKPGFYQMQAYGVHARPYGMV